MPGERACHGRHAPGCRAKQDSESEERLGPVPKRGEDSDAQGCSAGQRAPFCKRSTIAQPPQGFTACLSNKRSVHVWTGAHLKSTFQS